MKRQIRSSGFTIIELIVSISLVLILMLGVSTVFKTISSTVSAGSAISDNTRVARGAQAVFAQDFGAAVTGDAPCMILHSQVQPGFRNRVDLLGDRDYVATGAPAALELQTRTTDINGDNIENNAPGELVPAPTINFRNHRIDTFSFFTRGLFKRQTGGSVASGGIAPFIADQTSSEAWVWYGHLRIANSAGQVLAAQDPGAGTLGSNDNNFLASQWVLGREAILLREAEGSPVATINDRNGTAQFYISGGGQLSPLSYGTGDQPSGTFTIQQSRYDIADTSITSFRQKLLAYIAANPGGTWWQTLFGSGGQRFQADPVVKKPVSAITVSQQAPIFIPGCSSFVVEFAGDYVEQARDPAATATYGNVTGVYAPVNPTVTPAKTDGVTDFIVVNGQRQIRWYGLPRDTNGDGLIQGWAATRTNNQMPDVVPLRDVMRTLASEVTSNGAAFEKQLVTKLPIPPGGDYMMGMLPSHEYNCGWGPGDKKPTMIRITLVIDDPAGRNPNPDGQTFEYVFELP